MSKKGIDYSKWDQFEYSSSDEEEDEPSTTRTPRVTRLDEPSRITTQADGSITFHSSPDTTSPEPRENTQATTESSPKRQPETSNTTSKAFPPDVWMDKGGTTMISVSRDRDEQREIPLYWTQDRYSVTLRIGVQQDAHKKKMQWKVRIQNILAYADRHAGVSSALLPVLIVESESKDGSRVVLLKEELPYPVYRAKDDGQDDDDDDDTSIDWNMEPGGAPDDKFLTITLYKAAPMEGLTLWWNRPLACCQETDISSWRDKAVGGSSTSSGSTFQQAWNEAHVIFRDQIKTKGHGENPL